MQQLPIRQLVQRAGMIVIFFTILMLGLQRADIARGLWVATIWQAASVGALALCARLLQPPYTARRRWLLAGLVTVKFPLLYAAGWLALRHLAPHAIGLAVGLTIPWAVLVAHAVGALWRSQSTWAATP